MRARTGSATACVPRIGGEWAQRRTSEFGTAESVVQDLGLACAGATGTPSNLRRSAEDRPHAPRQGSGRAGGARGSSSSTASTEFCSSTTTSLLSASGCAAQPWSRKNATAASASRVLAVRSLTPKHRAAPGSFVPESPETAECSGHLTRSWPLTLTSEGERTPRRWVIRRGTAATRLSDSRTRLAALPSADETGYAGRRFVARAVARRT